MKQTPLIQAIVERLQKSGYSLLSTPLIVAGVEFHFTTSMRGYGGRSLDLILLIDTTSGDFGDHNADRIIQRVEALSRALDYTDSRFVITTILAGAPLENSIESLTERCRVLYVENLSFDINGNLVDEATKLLLEDRIRILLPLDLPMLGTYDLGEGSAISELNDSLKDTIINTDLYQALIEASQNGEAAVTEVAAYFISQAIELEEQK